MSVLDRIETWTHDQRGAGIVEYALVVALIAVVSIGAIRLVGERVLTDYECTTVRIEQPGLEQAVRDKIKNGDVLDKFEERFAVACL